MAADDSGPGASASDARTEVEGALVAHVDGIVRELVKLKLLSRPKGGAGKEEKARLVVEGCLGEGSDEYLERLCQLMAKAQLDHLAERLRLLARPPPPVETVTEDVVEETGEQDSPLDPAGAPKEAPSTEPAPPKPRPYTEVLHAASGTFLDCLHLSRGLLDHLEASRVLSPDMRAKIVCCSCRGEKIRVLLQFLMSLGPESLQQFIAALRATEQDFLANILAATPFT